MLGHKRQHRAIEHLGLLPVNRVPRFRRHHQFGIRDFRRDDACDGGRRGEVGGAADHQRRHLEGGEHRLGDAVLKRLAEGVDEPGFALKLDPLPKAIRIAGTIGWPDLANFDRDFVPDFRPDASARGGKSRSEEHTSELQSHLNLVCRLLLEKKKKIYTTSSLSDASIVLSRYRT